MTDLSEKKNASSEPAWVAAPQDDPLAVSLRLALGYVSGKKETHYAAELGVYRGRSLQVLMSEGMATGANFNWIGIDTFSGLPPLGEKDIELAPENSPYLLRPMYDDTTLREVEAFLEPMGMGDRLKLYEGLLADVLPGLPERMYTFVNISIKTYEAHLQALEYFYPRMREGGVIVLDDVYNRRFPMAEIAVNEFLADKPEQIFQLTGADNVSLVKRGLLVKHGPDTIARIKR